MNKMFIVVIVLVVIALGVGIYFFSVSKKGSVNNDLPVQENNPTATVTSTTEPTVQAVDVVIKDLAFNPAELQVKVGTEVRWINQDSTGHTITNTNFDSGEIKNGQSYSHVFTAVDIYDYHCSINPSMTGKIIVTP